MLLQLAATLALLLGGIYALYCISRVASSLDRMASAMEMWATQRNEVEAQTPMPPSTFPLLQPQPTPTPHSPPVAPPLATPYSTSPTQRVEERL